MSTAFVLGNGISRRGISAAMLRKHGVVFGCNALYREFTPDVLVATDRFIADAIQDTGYAKNNTFYTRRPQKNSGALALPNKYTRSASGPNAVHLAIEAKHSKIFLLGFDMGPTADNKINNIYAGTDFYRDKGTEPVCPDKWIADLIQITQENRFVQFTRVMGIGSASIANLHIQPNVTVVTVSEFLAKFK